MQETLLCRKHFYAGNTLAANNPSRKFQQNSEYDIKGTHRENSVKGFHHFHFFISGNAGLCPDHTVTGIPG